MVMIPVNEIIIKDRFRKNIDREKVRLLAESIKEIGLQQPIKITQDKTLIFGMHRLEAVKLNGFKEIKCDISTETDPLKVELAEIDENLMRNDLHYLDRGLHLARRKEIYELLYPQTIPRNKPGHVNNFESSSEIISYEPKPFTEDVANRLNVSQRTVQNEIQIAKNLIPEMQQLVVEKDIGKVDAIKVARLPSEDQKKVVDKINIEGAGTVQTAITELKREGKIKQPETKNNPEDGMPEDIRDVLQTVRLLDRQIPILVGTNISETDRNYLYEYLSQLYQKLEKAISILSKKDNT
ncbi:ParB/RepB/Spo0J family partition protein [Ruminiclostridium cellobioparum]|uniref:ParB/RepB/Spo0J family partition protein n=1 Tax=Ruminiclostridium cellobioparum TaxID=29355 RepID=UPI0028ACA8CE|nr:ParB/RepB/Spo0J family partition protein [Ruminiclostridium cellobioparum]